ncbi:ABC transporter substrate-binding protein [Chelatococcus reniformis]|uniref:ABC transporter substrate-binding protein n=1 Tax=Chelatococcus reniformis TaxID=1494448 RepID=A0A916U410_9HYPH|nr:ABC transporter substrate-binding protein [Chelatococcus reniformis]GGC56568.1 ABC transporter substrate-binding protein [Chelatococcus reniformis]
MFNRLRVTSVAIALAGLGCAAGPGLAQQKYDPGVSDTEIKIGNIMPYSGPASAFGAIGATYEAYLRMINDQGGINGRKINFLSYDDSYSPPKAVEQTRKLVEGDNVLLMFGAAGTPSNTAIQKYLNAKRVPQLFVTSGATKWGDPKNYPWTIGWQPTYQVESEVYAKYIQENHPAAKIGILFQNDDFGKDYLQAFKTALGDKAKGLIVTEIPYEITSPTIDAEILKLKASGADVFFNVSTPKFAAQAIRKMAEIQWKPVHMLSIVSVSVSSVLKPAGLENAQGILSVNYSKDPTDPRWKDDAGVKEWNAFMDKYMPRADKDNWLHVPSYSIVQTLVQVLRQAGDDLTRENVMRQAANLKDFTTGMLLPGITINTSPTNFYPIRQMQMMRFKDDRWEMFGPVVSSDAKG